MKKYNSFMKFHFLIIIFFTVMYITGVFHLDYKWNIPIKHPVIGLLMLLGMVIYIIFNKKKNVIINIFKYNVNLKKGKSSYKYFKWSVILLAATFFVSVTTGTLLYSGLIKSSEIYRVIYTVHSSVRYGLVILILFHLISRVVGKQSK